MGAVALSPAMGCVIVQSDDDEDGEASFNVGWMVDGLTDDGDGCAELPYFDHVEVVSAPPGDDPYIDIFDCQSGEGVTDPLPLGDYDLWVNVRDEDSRLLAQSRIVETSLESDGEEYFVDHEFAFLNAEFVATWELQEEYTEEPRTCGEVGAGGVSILSSLASPSGTAFDDIFDCPDSDTQGDVETDPLPLGDYDVQISLLEAGTDDTLGSVVRQGELNEHATPVDLGIYTFEFAPEGDEGRIDVVWKVDGLDDDFGDGCAELPAFDAVEVVAQNGESEFSEEFDCQDGGAVIEDLPLDDYDVFARTRDTSDRIVAESETQTVEIEYPVTVDVPEEFAFLNAAFDLEWELDRDNDTRSCAEEDVESVEVAVDRDDDEGTSFTDSFECDEGFGVTEALPLGNYEVFVTLRDDGDDAIATTAERDVSLSEHASVIDLGIFVFVFES